MDATAQMHRLAAYRIHQSLVEKPLRLEQFWPMWGDKKTTQDKLVMDQDMWEKIKKAHNIN